MSHAGHQVMLAGLRLLVSFYQGMLLKKTFFFFFLVCVCLCVCVGGCLVFSVYGIHIYMYIYKYIYIYVVDIAICNARIFFWKTVILTQLRRYNKGVKEPYILAQIYSTQKHLVGHMQSAYLNVSVLCSLLKGSPKNVFALCCCGKVSE